MQFSHLYSSALTAELGTDAHIINRIMNSDAEALLLTHIAHRASDDAAKIRANTIEKHCVQCGAWFLAGGAYRKDEGGWRKHKAARFCSLKCSSLFTWRDKRGPNWTDETLKPISSPTVRDLAWAAGVYEGEGSVSGGKGIKAVVVQKDRWLLHRLQTLFGGNVLTRRSYDKRRNRIDEVGVWAISGPRGRGFLMTIFSFLSPRRQEQIRAALRNDGRAI